MSNQFFKMQKYFLRLGSQEQILFAKRLAVLINAGVPIAQALSLLANQAVSFSAKYILTSIHNEVESGQFLSSAMARFVGIFGELSINIVRIGEVSGTLGNNLNYLAEELKKKRQLKKKIISAFIYPCLILLATGGIAALLAGYVLPKILPVFKSFKQSLPFATRSLIYFSDFIGKYWAVIIIIFIIFCGLIIFSLKQKLIRSKTDRVILIIPLLGSIFKSYCLANFCRTLGLLIKSEVRIVEAVNIAANTAGNLAFQKELLILSERVSKGEKLSLYMSKKSNFFPPTLTQMVGVGEATGNLSTNLIYLATFYEEELEDLSKNLSNAIEPALMILMGVMVGFVAIAIITPIYGISQNIHP